MAGGDGKYLASLFLIMPSQWHWPFLYYLGAVTVVMASILLLMRVFKNFKNVISWIRDKKGFEGILGSRFAFAPIILMAWIWMGINVL